MYQMSFIYFQAMQLVVVHNLGHHQYSSGHGHETLFDQSHMIEGLGVFDKSLFW